MSGPVATSMSGIPKRSVLHTTSSLLVSTRRQASSSRQTERMEIFLSPTLTAPSVEISAVLWKPEVLEPSTTIFLMKWTSSIRLAPSISENVRAILMASALTSWGGSSSSSTRQLVPSQHWYLYPRCLWNWAKAARSISPISEVVGLSLL